MYGLFTSNIKFECWTMPRVQRQAIFSQISDFDRGVMVTLYIGKMLYM